MSTDLDITLMPTVDLLEIIFSGEVQLALAGAIPASDIRLHIFNADGTNPISPDAFNGGYNPQMFGFNPGVQNFAQFNMQRFLNSPDLEPNVPFPGPTNTVSTETGDVTFLTTPDGFTWRYQAALQSSIFGFDPADYSFLPTPVPLTDPFIASVLTGFRAPGDISVTNVSRNTVLEFTEDQGTDRYLLTDAFGNQYLQVFSRTGDPAQTAQNFFNVPLPAGWTREILSADAVLDADVDPGGDIRLTSTQSGDGRSNVVVVTDAFGSVFQQVGWGDSGITLGTTIEGFQIWGGVSNDMLLGDVDDSTSFDNEIFGGHGNDTLNGGGGEDTLMGGADDDLLIGGADDDVFYFSSDNGVDTVADFEDGDALVFDGEDLADAIGDSVIMNGEVVSFTGGGEAEIGFDGEDVTITYSVEDEADTIVILEDTDLPFVTSVDVGRTWSNGFGSNVGTAGGFIGSVTIENATGADQIELFADLDLDSFDFNSIWVGGLGNPKSIDVQEGIVEILPTGNPFWQPVIADGDSVTISFKASTTDQDALAAILDGDLETFLFEDASLDAFWG